MSVESNKALIRRVFDETLNRGEMAVIDEVFAPHMVDRGEEPGDMDPLNAIKEFVTNVRRTFPNLHVTIERLIGEGNQVASAEIWRGNHAVTGQPVEGRILHIFVCDGDRVVEEWSKGWEWLEGIAFIPETSPPAQEDRAAGA